MILFLIVSILQLISQIQIYKIMAGNIVGKDSLTSPPPYPFILVKMRLLQIRNLHLWRNMRGEGGSWILIYIYMETPKKGDLCGDSPEIWGD